MYCIITNNEKVIKCALREGVQVVEIEKEVSIKNKQEIKYVEITSDMTQNFLRRFPKLDEESLGTKVLKYIWQNHLGDNEDLENIVYPKVAKALKRDICTIRKSIASVYVECITKIPKCYEKFFEQYEFSIHWEMRFLSEFIKACQKYIEENAEYLSQKYTDKERLIPTTIEGFLKRFGKVDEESLGYRSLKYILENELKCTGNYHEDVYDILTKLYKTDTRAIRLGLTCIIKKFRNNIPIEYREFFNKYTEDNAVRGPEERNFRFLRICQLYIAQHMIV